MVSSAAARRNTPYWGGYAMSKAALEMITFTYAAECNGTQVKVNALDPGPVRTIMRAKAMPGEDPATLPRPDELTPMILEALSPSNEKNGELIKFRKCRSWRSLGRSHASFAAAQDLRTVRLSRMSTGHARALRAPMLTDRRGFSCCA